MDPMLLMLLLSSLGTQSNNFLGGGQQQTNPLGSLAGLLSLLGYGQGGGDQSLGGAGNGVSALFEALFGSAAQQNAMQNPGYQQTFYNPNASTPAPTGPYGVNTGGVPSLGIPSLAPGQSYTTPGQQVYTQPGPSSGPLGSAIYNYANAPFTPMGAPGIGAIQGYGFGLDPTIGGRGGPVLTGYVGERHKTDPVPIGWVSPNAWGGSTYMGGGQWSQSPDTPQWIRDLSAGGLGYAATQAGARGGMGGQSVPGFPGMTFSPGGIPQSNAQVQSVLNSTGPSFFNPVWDPTKRGF